MPCKSLDIWYPGVTRKIQKSMELGPRTRPNVTIPLRTLSQMTVSERHIAGSQGINTFGHRR